MVVRSSRSVGNVDDDDDGGVVLVLEERMGTVGVAGLVEAWFGVGRRVVVEGVERARVFWMLERPPSRMSLRSLRCFIVASMLSSRSF